MIFLIVSDEFGADGTTTVTMTAESPRYIFIEGNIEEGTASLTATVNSAEAQLQLQYGELPGYSSPWEYGHISATNPTPGMWYLGVQQNAGPYEITITGMNAAESCEMELKYLQ